jgi:predicted secreted hydrolase
MKSSAKSLVAVNVALLLIAVLPACAQYKTALPGYRYEFPRDHFSHPEFQTEWWYYTGNLTAADGHRFGFELTFFRQGVSRDASKTATWDVKDVYLAHLALSDVDGGKFYHAERTNRAGPQIAGVSATTRRSWNGNWSAEWKGDAQQLRAVDERFALDLLLHSDKPPVIHGENGVSQKAEGTGHASHYISFTRLQTSGAVRLLGKDFQVTGTAWMDHEFFTQQLSSEQSGWDWFSVQLSDNTELMLFELRRRDGTIDPFSAGTYVDAKGKGTHLRAADFSLKPTGASWKSSVTGATYPIQWSISVPSLGLQLEATTRLKPQELSGSNKFSPSYWEGAMELQGQRNGAAARGVGYLEMTGYDHPVRFGEVSAGQP